MTLCTTMGDTAWAVNLGGARTGGRVAGQKRSGRQTFAEIREAESRGQRGLATG